MNSPLQRYQRDLIRTGFSPDPAQQRAVQHLQNLYEQLIENHRHSQSRRRRLAGFGNVVDKFISVLRPIGKRPGSPLRGLYFWGGVGRGKTYLMDSFFESLPFEGKMRVHFHRFMRRVHRELKSLSGEQNPLLAVAERLSKDVCIICFDEFFVADIADAMILARLLDALFCRGVSLVMTSNIVPDDLYKDGLQRDRFLPAIALINTHTRVVNVDGGVDYRLRELESAALYYYPLGAGADTCLLASFESLVPKKERIRSNVLLEIENRPLRARYEAEDVVWFDFSVLCDGPRSQNDYIELAREYHAVVIANIPALASGQDDQARRFISLVDEFYDRNVKLVISAALPLEKIYTGGKLDFEFKRTASRLLEMQSHEYLARAHRP